MSSIFLLDPRGALQTSYLAVHPGAMKTNTIMQRAGEVRRLPAPPPPDILAAAPSHLARDMAPGGHADKPVRLERLGCPLPFSLGVRATFFAVYYATLNSPSCPTDFTLPTDLGDMRGVCRKPSAPLPTLPSWPPSLPPAIAPARRSGGRGEIRFSMP